MFSMVRVYHHLTCKYTEQLDPVGDDSRVKIYCQTIGKHTADDYGKNLDKYKEFSNQFLRVD